MKVEAVLLLWFAIYFASFVFPEVTISKALAFVMSANMGRFPRVVRLHGSAQESVPRGERGAPVSRRGLSTGSDHGSSATADPPRVAFCGRLLPSIRLHRIPSNSTAGDRSSGRARADTLK